MPGEPRFAKQSEKCPERTWDKETLLEQVETRLESVTTVIFVHGLMALAQF